ncbi:MAG: Na+/H+ antiporter NhaC [Synergistaceae bacterium]|jgi:NhaC family Na+:H+ antiporter|nr:Na+/H+ antiporter NhaC [Synergistaceae bacterium]MBP9559368.1 Na+/H+ antiporter NhaC [Synergistaceae bacterium]PKL03917.1 MAG: Na+/H+ antiporter NhaC [Synergistetes bacterium HGW-Synergistetes-1]
MEPRKPSLALTLALFLTVAAMIAASVLVWEVDIHITLILGAMLTIAIGVAVLKYDYATIEKGIIDGIMTGMQACLILYTVGPLIGTWILSGVVPTMIYYGLAILNPSIFLFATLLICSVVSLSTGTSWGTSGTVGIALMGIALGLGIPAPLTAGVVISGAYFGDKMSPLSDTTNLAPAVAGTDLFQHIRAMVWTTGPTYIIVAVITIVIGFRYAGGELDAAKIAAIQALMRAEFWINPVTLIAPLVVIGLSAARKPALPSLWAGIFVAIVIALVNGSGIGEILNIMQYGYVPTVSASIAGAGEDAAALAKVLAESNITVAPDIALEAANDIVKLMERGGLQSMNWTISLIICAFTFGFSMDTCGFLKVMLEAIMKPIKSVGGMVTATILSCFVCDIFLGDQYLSIAMPGTMFRSAYEEKGLHPRMLSRSLEDAGTLLSVLIPWNTCGAYHTTVLGVPTLEYAPYAFLNYLNPIVAILLTYMGIGIAWRGKEGEPVISKTRPANLV